MNSLFLFFETDEQPHPPALMSSSAYAGNGTALQQTRHPQTGAATREVEVGIAEPPHTAPGRHAVHIDGRVVLRTATATQSIVLTTVTGIWRGHMSRANDHCSFADICFSVTFS